MRTVIQPNKIESVDIIYYITRNKQLQTMAQSDHIRYKRLHTEIKNKKLSNILASQDYTNYKQFSYENTIINTKPIFHQLTPSGENIVFDMKRTQYLTSDCSFNYPICQTCNQRINRVLNINVTTTSGAPIIYKPAIFDKTSKKNDYLHICQCIM